MDSRKRTWLAPAERPPRHASIFRRLSIRSFANNTSPIAVAKNGLTLPRYQNWSLTFERQLNANMRLDVSYIANRGTRLTADWQKMGVGANMNPSSILSIPNSTLTANCSWQTLPLVCAPVVSLCPMAPSTGA